MSPLDDELRTLLGQRAADIAPSPDPLAGIESRARRIRRNRIAASLTGAALAVAVVAAVVPSVLPDKLADGGSTQFADDDAPDRASEIPPSGLDPANPWPYRGNPSLISDGAVQALRDAWAAANHPESQISPLVGLENKSSKETEIAFVSTAKGVNTFAVATTSISGWQVLYQAPFTAGETALMAALPGDEVPRLMVVASPRTIGDLSYASDGSSFATANGPFPGVAFVPLEGDTSKDAVRVLDGNGDLDKPLFLGPAPDYQRVDRPDNAVIWKTSGYPAPSAEFVEKAVAAFATGMGHKRVDVDYQILVAGEDDAKNVYVFGQAWAAGQPAQSFGLVRNGRGEETPLLGAVTTSETVLAFAIPAGVGQSTETIAVAFNASVVASVLYGAAASEYRAVGAGQDLSSGVVLVERDPRAQGDKLKLADSAGTTVFEGEVASLLCGIKGCG